MNDLQDLRNKIDEIDKKIALLFNDRMEIVSKIRDIKKTNNLSTYNEEREKSLINNNKEFVKKEYQEYFVELEKQILKLSKDYQNK